MAVQSTIVELTPRASRGPTVRAAPPAAEASAETLDEALRERWNLGRNLALAWSREGGRLAVLWLPFYRAADLLREGAELEGRKPALHRLLCGSRRVSQTMLHRIAEACEAEPETVVPAPTSDTLRDVDLDRLLRRYGISRLEDTAVALVDIAGFSLVDPLEQVTQLNSLAYSLNAAEDKLAKQGIDVDIARSTTGDGFFIWNRRPGAEANLRLLQFLQLVLADNAIARSKSRAGVVPLLKTAFHIGDGYEFFQAEGLRPTMQDYIVGRVTIELARMLDHAAPGQVLMGDFFTRTAREDGESAEPLIVDAAAFIEQAGAHAEDVRGLKLSGEALERIECYLTGPGERGGPYGLSRYRIIDKHGLQRDVFNAKMNLYREGAAPIYLGLQDQDVLMEAAAG